MKQKKIRFFSPQDNEEVKTKEAPKEITLKCLISKTGRLAFPQKTQEELGINPADTRFRVGTEERKRTFKTLFLIPVDKDQSDAFELVKTGRGYTIPLSGIFDKVGLDYSNHEYEFTVKPFQYEEGVTGFELQLSGEAAPRQKQEGGKRRGRKPANQAADE